MIIRSALTAVLFLVLYSGVLFWFPREIVRIGASRDQGNLVRLERVAFDETPITNILVGTSLSGVILQNNLGPGFASLALNGMSPLTGIEALLKSSNRPKRIFLEINLIEKPVDQYLIDHVSGTKMATLRKVIPLLRTSSQPLTLFRSWIQNRVSPPLRLSNPALVKIGLDYYKSSFQSAIPLNAIDASAKRLSHSIELLRQGGSKVILVEFPIHPKLATSPRHTALLNELSKRFPEDLYQWIRPNPTNQYETTDGIHLDSPCALRFTEIIRKAAT